MQSQKIYCKKISDNDFNDLQIFLHILHSLRLEKVFNA